jgi:uncharacterized repeat protein (TIGR01451 family)
MDFKRTINLALTAALALILLGGVTWMLALRQPTTAAAAVSVPAAIQGLPTPYLNHPDVVDAPYDNPPAPTVDGAIAPGEYAGAGKVTFEGYGGYYDEVETFFTQDGITLYVAFELPDKINHTPVPAVSIFLDTNNDGGSAPQTDDFRFEIRRNGGTATWQGNGTTWIATPIAWANGKTETMSGWSAEFAIPFTTIGIGGGAFQELGLALSNSGIASQDHYWPPGASPAQPATWGSLVSSSDWGVFYWKPGPWEDYAPSGMPDFDQKKPAWGIPGPTGIISTHCGPAAMANSLWWFDSKFEALTSTTPPVISDTYRLVTSYNPGGWDDHDPQNVVPFVDDLANNYFGTNQGLIGTNVISMFHGTHRYLRRHGLWDDYQVTLVVSPTFRWVADEVMRSEDVILLLGFYEWQETVPGGQWVRVGGHYVNVAGVDPNPGGPMIAFSDPYVDNAEVTGAGRVLSGTLLPHYPPHPGPDPTIHDDAGNVSHDVYPVVATNSPGGVWGPAEYPWKAFRGWFTGLEPLWINPHPEIENGEYLGSENIQIEVEYALAVSPYTWKSSGYWEEDLAIPPGGVWQPWQDYAPNGVPDFDQKQDSWGLTPPGPPPWTYCGPVAAANSLWWFDSKFEPNPVAPTTPGLNDGYPMVWSYAPLLPAWDDHDPLNVDSGAAAPPPPPVGPPPWWPGSGIPGEFVDELAAYFDTDGQMTGYGLHAGTVITDMYKGINQYLLDRIDPANPGPPLRQGYVITMTKSPDFWWVAEEVEHSEDVILLLGFWQNQDGIWVRLGGHYVTAPGVDKQGGFIAFSDPYYDGAEYAWPYAYPAGTPTVMGRVADGWLIPHPPYHSHASTVHNDAGNVSHDIYTVGPTDSPGGVWGPRNYVEGGWPSVEPFWGQNGTEGYPPPSPDPIQAEVDWAIAVSPVADVWAQKGFESPTAIPGETVTITIRFGNDGSLPAENVVLTETLPGGLIGPAVVGSWTSNGKPIVHRTGTAFTWDLPDLAWSEWGVITLTAQVDPSLTWPASQTITNTVEISTGSIEQYQVPERPNTATATLTVQTADVQIAKSVRPAALRAGDWLTYTLVYTNSGSVPAANTVITDQLHAWLVNASTSGPWTSYPSVIMPVPTGRYVWSIGSVPAGGWGVLTVTAQVSPTLGGGGTLPNDALVSTATPESDYTNNAASANATVEYYAVDLQPGTGGITDNPGEIVTYTLTVYNTGNLTDTYTIAGSVSGEAWATNWPGSVGPVAGGSSAQIDVTVQISSTAQSGDTSTATIVATSQGDSSKSATSVLTTTAQTGTITRGVAVAPATATGNGDPGDTVTYTLRITNTGTAADVIDLSYTGPSTWTVSFSANPVSLAARAGTDVKVTVTIPAGAPDGSTGVFTVTAASQADPTETDAAILTTTVSWRFIYLPLVLRNY